MKSPILSIATAAAFVFAIPSFAAGSAADNVSAVDPYVRLAPPGQMVTGAFVVFKNSDDKDHKVVKADSAVSKVAELHTHTMEGGMMKMRPVKDIEIKAKGETALQPGGLHIMLIDLKQPLKEGENVAISITFEDGSSKKFDAQVRKPQAAMAMPMPMDHDHKGMKH
ncbi:MAG: copper chaperone PCu(A)C [Sulfuricella denitrificans]|nr:copper chaperone PCu(A)C [Sulfuricella denitrificans]